MIAVAFEENVKETDSFNCSVENPAEGNPDIIVECKAPSIKITQETFDQIARYNLKLNANYLIVTNGINHYYCKMDFEKEEYVAASRKMINNVLGEIENYGAGYSNWAMLLQFFSQPFYEVAIVGKSVDEKRKSLNKYYYPNKIFAMSAETSTLPLLRNRFKKDETLIYVCRNKTCLQPVKDVEDALKQMQIK